MPSDDARTDERIGLRVKRSRRPRRFEVQRSMREVRLAEQTNIW